MAISGVDFDMNTVAFDGTVASIEDDGEFGIDAITPAHAAGNVPIIVTNNDGQVAAFVYDYSDSGGGGGGGQAPAAAL